MEIYLVRHTDCCIIPVHSYHRSRQQDTATAVQRQIAAERQICCMERIDVLTYVASSMQYDWHLAAVVGTNGFFFCINTDKYVKTVSY